MRWVRLGLDLSLACYGVWLLLTAYRVVGKPPGRTRSTTPGTDSGPAP